MALGASKIWRKNPCDVAHNIQEAKDERLFITPGARLEVVEPVLGQKMNGVSSQG